MDKSDIEVYSSFFTSPELATLYIGGLQWFSLSPKDYFKSLHSSFSDYLSQKDRIFSFVLPEEKKDPRVKDVLAVLDETLSKYSGKLSCLKFAGLLYGSIYFGDPSSEPDIDFDFAVFSKLENSDNLLEIILDEVDSNLLEFTQKPSHGKVICLEDYETKLNGFIHQNYVPLMGDEDFIMDVSLFLTAKRVYCDFCDNNFIGHKLNCLEGLIECAVQKSSVFRSLVINEFINIENDRKRLFRPVYNDNA